MQYKQYGDYYVYEDGTIESHKYKTPRVLRRKNRKNGYQSVSLRVNGLYEEWLIHRLVAILFIPNSLNKPQIDHIDGDKTNNCVSNLRWVTQYENYHNPNTINKHRHLKGIDKVYTYIKKHIAKDGTVTYYTYHKYYKAKGG